MDSGKRAGATVVALLLAAAPAAAASAVVVRPLHSPAGKIVYPRIVAGVSAAVRRTANQVLASQEENDRDQRADCIEQIRTAGDKPEADSFTETVAVTYVSARYLSLDVRQSYFCATAYPTDGAPNPLTIDLADGKALDLKTLFRPGFLPREGAMASARVIKLYRAHYAAPPDTDACRDVIADDASFNDGVDLWLDAAKGGLVVQPDFPHVIAACAVPIVLGAKDLAADANAKFLGDLGATVAAAAPHTR
jgi:hypothetical protein